MNRAYEKLNEIRETLKTFSLFEISGFIIRSVMVVSLEDSGYVDIYYAKKAYEKALRRISRELGMEFEVNTKENYNSEKELVIGRVK